MSRNTQSTYLEGWLPAFEAARQKGVAVLDAFGARLASELRELASGERDRTVSSPDGEETTVGGQRAAQRPVGWLRLIGLMWRQHALMRAAFRAAPDQRTALVALSTRRLPFTDAASPRLRLKELTRALPGSPDPDAVGRTIDECPRILLLEPHAVSSLWANPAACWSERVFIVDTFFLGFSIATKPFWTLAQLYRGRGRLFVAGQRRKLQSKAMLAAVALDVVYRGLLADAGRMRAVLLSSNSFVTEVLRAFLMSTPRCEEIVEVLHGVPTFEFEEYMAAVLRLAPGSKHRFVPQVRELPLYGSFASTAGDGSFAVSTAANKYRLSRGGHQAALIDQLEGERARLLGQRTGTLPLIVAITGANSHDQEYFKSNTYAVERAIIRHARLTLQRSGRDFVLFYTPHPLHPWRVVSNERFFAQHEVLLYADTTFTWLIADACIALHSSALFDAAFAGARVFTPMRADDGIYPLTLLRRLAHPAPGQSTLDALTEFLIASARQPHEDWWLRMRQRAARLWSLEQPLPASAAAAPALPAERTFGRERS